MLFSTSHITYVENNQLVFYPKKVMQEGRGKLSGCVGAFTCVTEDKTRFDAKMMGDTEYLRKCFEDHSLWQGKRLTVKFQGLTNKNGVPRFPVGVRIREEE